MESGRPFSLVLAAFCLAAVFAAHSHGASAPELYRQGVKAEKAGRTQEARARYLEAEKADPLYPQPTYALALLYLNNFLREHTGYQEAKESFSRLDTLLGARPPAAGETALYLAYLDYAELLLIGKENVQALKYYDRFVEAYPDHLEMERVHNGRGVALFKLNRYEEAAESFRKAFAYDPNFIAPRVNLRGLFLRMGSFEQARLAHRQGKMDEALGRVDELLRIASGLKPALRLRGDILRDMARYDEALAAYETVLAADEEDLITHGIRLDMAAIEEKRGNLGAALTLLNANAIRFNRIQNDPTRANILRIMNLLKAKQ